MQDSRYDTGPGFFQGVSHVNASHGIFNHIEGPQYNYSNAMDDEMVVRRSSYHINPNIIEFHP
jgi:hypothetical protein